MAALAPLLGLAAAFKVGSVLGVFAAAAPRLRRRCASWDSARRVPLLGAAAALVFLFSEENPIWGGTIASTLTGEFSYTYGIGLALLFLGRHLSGLCPRGRPLGPAAVLAVTALAHGYAVLWAGLSATYFLYASRRPGARWAGSPSVAGLAFALSAFWLAPLLSAWGWTTPYDDPWITIALKNLLAAVPVAAPRHSLLGLVWMLLLAFRGRAGPDHRLMFRPPLRRHRGGAGRGRPALGIIDVRFVPFAQLAPLPGRGITIGLALQRLAAGTWPRSALVLLGVVYARRPVARCCAPGPTGTTPGCEAKELWPAFARDRGQLRGTVSGPARGRRVPRRRTSARAPSACTRRSRSSRAAPRWRASTTRPACRPMPCTSSPPSSTRPRRTRSASASTRSFDTESALRHLRLFDVSQVVALSPAPRGQPRCAPGGAP